MMEEYVARMETAVVRANEAMTKLFEENALLKDEIKTLKQRVTQLQNKEKEKAARVPPMKRRKRNDPTAASIEMISASTADRTNIFHSFTGGAFTNFIDIIDANDKPNFEEEVNKQPDYNSDFDEENRVSKDSIEEEKEASIYSSIRIGGSEIFTTSSSCLSLPIAPPKSMLYTGWKFLIKNVALPAKIEADAGKTDYKNQLVSLDLKPQKGVRVVETSVTLAPLMMIETLLLHISADNVNSIALLLSFRDTVLVSKCIFNAIRTYAAGNFVKEGDNNSSSNRDDINPPMTQDIKTNLQSLMSLLISMYRLSGTDVDGHGSVGIPRHLRAGTSVLANGHSARAVLKALRLRIIAAIRLAMPIDPLLTICCGVHARGRDTVDAQWAELYGENERRESESGIVGDDEQFDGALDAGVIEQHDTPFSKPSKMDACGWDNNSDRKAELEAALMDDSDEDIAEDCGVESDGNKETQPNGVVQVTDGTVVSPTAVDVAAKARLLNRDNSLCVRCDIFTLFMSRTFFALSAALGMGCMLYDEVYACIQDQLMMLATVPKILNFSAFAAMAGSIAGTVEALLDHRSTFDDVSTASFFSSSVGWVSVSSVALQLFHAYIDAVTMPVDATDSLKAQVNSLKTRLLISVTTLSPIAAASSNNTLIKRLNDSFSWLSSPEIACAAVLKRLLANPATQTLAMTYLIRGHGFWRSLALLLRMPSSSDYFDADIYGIKNMYAIISDVITFLDFDPNGCLDGGRSLSKLVAQRIAIIHSDVAAPNYRCANIVELEAALCGHFNEYWMSSLRSLSESRTYDIVISLRVATCLFHSVFVSEYDSETGGYRISVSGFGTSLQERLTRRIIAYRSQLKAFLGGITGFDSISSALVDVQEVTNSITSSSSYSIEKQEREHSERAFDATSLSLHMVEVAAAFHDKACHHQAVRIRGLEKSSANKIVDADKERKITHILEDVGRMCCVPMIERILFYITCSVRGAVRAIGSLLSSRVLAPSSHLIVLLNDMTRFMASIPAPIAGQSTSTVNRDIRDCINSSRFVTTSCHSPRPAPRLPMDPEQLQQLQQLQASETYRWEQAQGLLLPVFIINLDRRPDRWRSMLFSCGRHGLAALRVSAVDGQKLSLGGNDPLQVIPESDVTTHWDSTLNATFDGECTPNSSTPMTNSERACASSHLTVWRSIAEIRRRLSSPPHVTEELVQDSSGSGFVSLATETFAHSLLGGGWGLLDEEGDGADIEALQGRGLLPSPGADWYLVLEDDAEFNYTPLVLHVGLSVAIYHIVNSLPADFDICYLGHAIPSTAKELAQRREHKAKEYGDATAEKRRISCTFLDMGALLKVRYAWMLHAYVIRGRSVEKLLSCLPINAPVDNFIAQLVFDSYLNAYAIDDQLAKQQGGSFVRRRENSDIRHSGRLTISGGWGDRGNTVSSRKGRNSGRRKVKGHKVRLKSKKWTTKK